MSRKLGTACALALLLAAAGAAAGCGGGGGLTAAQVVAGTVARTSTVRTFHLVVNVEHVPAPASGINLTYLEGDVSVPSALRARVSGTFLGVPLTSELIVIGTKHYLKDPFSGTWKVVSIAMIPASFFDPGKGVLAVVTEARDVVLAGSEQVGGVDCYRLTGKVPASAVTPLLGNPASAQLAPIELWVGKRDQLLRRVRLSGPLARGEGKNAARTVELSAFGERVRIVAPAT